MSGGAASVFVGALAPGDSVQAFVSIKSTVAGDITNTATVSLIQADSNPANNTFLLVTHILPGVSVTVLSAYSEFYRSRATRSTFQSPYRLPCRRAADRHRDFPRRHDRP